LIIGKIKSQRKIVYINRSTILRYKELNKLYKHRTQEICSPAIVLSLACKSAACASNWASHVANIAVRIAWFRSAT